MPFTVSQLFLLLLEARADKNDGRHELKRLLKTLSRDMAGVYATPLCEEILMTLSTTRQGFLSLEVWAQRIQTIQANKLQLIDS